jgi:hypothetical protein
MSEESVERVVTMWTAAVGTVIGPQPPTMQTCPSRLQAEHSVSKLSSITFTIRDRALESVVKISRVLLREAVVADSRRFLTTRFDSRPLPLESLRM